MIKFQIRPEWILRDPQGAGRGLAQLFELLAAIAAEGNLRRACLRLDLSYRHAWGLIRDGGQMLGVPLIDFTLLSANPFIPFDLQKYLSTSFRPDGP